MAAVCHRTASRRAPGAGAWGRSGLVGAPGAPLGRCRTRGPRPQHPQPRGALRRRGRSRRPGAAPGRRPRSRRPDNGVAAGLESRIPGDDGIRRQLHDAALLARESGSTGLLLNRLVDASLLAGRRVRSARSPAPRPSSVAACGVEVARSRIGPLAGRAALVIGARGTPGREVAHRLAEAGARVTPAGRGETTNDAVLTGLLAGADLG